MLDIRFIKENKDEVKKGVADKQYDPSLVDKAIEQDKKWRELLLKIQDLQTKRNELAKAVGRKISEKEKKEYIKEGKEVKEKLHKLEPQLDGLKKSLTELLHQIPNLPSSETPVGSGEDENVEIKKWGEPTKFDFKPKDHLELGTALGILDFEAGAKVSGSQFYYLYGDGAMLELALVQYAFELLSKEGFKPVITPDLAKSRYYLGTGYAPKGDEAQTYEIKGEDLGLIATAEVTLAGKHADETISYKDLPIKYIGYSHCFRQEAGAYGKYSKGMYRVHQFTKAEMFVYCLPEESEKMHQYLLKMEEKIYQNLGIPYRVLEMCTGDLGAMAARKYDIEAWMPGREDYGEVTSTSNCTDYQARNLNIRYKTKDNNNDYIHMINGTAIATSRTPLAIMENYQQKDGSIKVPEVLQKWMGKDKITNK